MLARKAGMTFGVEPGMRVADLFAGGGYYSEILSRAVGTLHRIDEAFVREELEAVGFRLAVDSDVLRNPSDDRTKVVFDPAVRRMTDRFVLRFEKS